MKKMMVLAFLLCLSSTASWGGETGDTDRTVATKEIFVSDLAFVRDQTAAKTGKEEGKTLAIKEPNPQPQSLQLACMKQKADEAFLRETDEKNANNTTLGFILFVIGAIGFAIYLAYCDVIAAKTGISVGIVLVIGGVVFVLLAFAVIKQLEILEITDSLPQHQYTFRLPIDRVDKTAVKTLTELVEKRGGKMNLDVMDMRADMTLKEGVLFVSLTSDDPCELLKRKVEARVVFDSLSASAYKEVMDKKAVETWQEKRQ